MPVPRGSANGLSEDEQIAYRSLPLIPMLSKRQAERSGKNAIKKGDTGKETGGVW